MAAYGRLKKKKGFIAKMITLIVVGITIPAVAVFLYMSSALAENRSLVIDKITEILDAPSGVVDQFFKTGDLNKLAINPVFGSLLLALIFGMIFSLALEMDQPMPVWIISGVVVVILLLFGMSSWAMTEPKVIKPGPRLTTETRWTPIALPGCTLSGYST